jgi:hypothetical protein
MILINRNYNLFLDDFRNPQDAFAYTKDTDFLKLPWIVVKSYDEFVAKILELYNEGHFPRMIAFDHDLADDHYNHLSGEIPYEEMKEKTGMHCARWLVDFCMDRNLSLPDFKVHSQNPAGKANIMGFLTNFQKHQENLHQ